MSLSVSVKAWFPTIIGRKLERIHASSGANRSAIFGIVLITYVHLLLSPVIYAEYASWGSVSAILHNSSSSVTHFATLSCTYCLINDCVPMAAPRYLCPPDLSPVPS